MARTIWAKIKVWCTCVSHEGRHEKNVTNDRRHLILERLAALFPATTLTRQSLQECHASIHLHHDTKCHTTHLITMFSTHSSQITDSRTLFKNWTDVSALSERVVSPCLASCPWSQQTLALDTANATSIKSTQQLQVRPNDKDNYLLLHQKK